MGCNWYEILDSFALIKSLVLFKSMDDIGWPEHTHRRLKTQFFNLIILDGIRERLKFSEIKSFSLHV